MTRLLYLPDDATMIQLEVDIPARQLAAAVNAGLKPLPVLSGSEGELIARQIGKTVIVAPQRKKGAAPPVFQGSRLTRRQRQVLELASNGYSNIEIARMMGISRRTVSYHLKGIRAQLKVEILPPVSRGSR